MNNMQAMLKQVKSLQNEMLKVKDEVEKTEFTGECSLVKATLYGNKKIKMIEFNCDSLDSDDVIALQDMVVVAINQAIDNIDSTMERKMSKFGNIPGLF